MYDSSFDAAAAELPTTDRRLLWVARIAGVALLAASASEAQMPNSPVLQNAWASPGLVTALDVAGGSHGSVYGLAGAWALGGRLQLSGGLGLGAGNGGSRTAYGVRAALPLGGASSSFGIGFFGGVGG